MWESMKIQNILYIQIKTKTYDCILQQRYHYQMLTNRSRFYSDWLAWG